MPALPAAAQSTIEIEAATGIDGWIESLRPFDLEITITSDVLFDGTIQASMGSVVVATSGQVPAGTTKVFSLTMPPPNSNGAVRIDLLDRDENRIETARVTPRYPTDEVLVGVEVGAANAGLDRLRTPIVDRPIVVLEVGETQTLGVLDYYLTTSLGDREVEFADAGGVVITEQTPNEGVQVSEGTSSRYRVGDGEIIVVQSIDEVGTYESLLLARARQVGPLEFWQSPDQGLSEAATSAGDGGVPELPWLLAAIIGYATLIGPVNFLILHRLRRRDLAWVTIPAISLLCLGVFWLLGGQRLEDAGLTHATVIIGGDDPIERNSVVLAVGREGTYTVGFDDVEIVYPATLGNRFDEFGRPLPTASAQVVGSEIEFDLQQLGFAGANAISSGDADLLDVDWGGADDTSVQVTNSGAFSYWAWGVYDAGRITVSDDVLEPGVTLALDLGNGPNDDFFEPEFGFFLGDAVINQLGLFDDRAWRVISPLGNAAQFTLANRPERFVFGFSETYQPAVTLNGRSTTSEGNTLVLVPSERADGSTGSLTGTLLGIGSGFIEPSGPGFDFISSDEMFLGYRLPDGVRSAHLSFTNRFGEDPLGQQAWDWSEAALVDINIGDVIGDRFIDPGGNVVLRIGANKQEFEGGFVEMPMSPNSFELAWGDR